MLGQQAAAQALRYLFLLAMAVLPAAYSSEFSCSAVKAVYGLCGSSYDTSVGGSMFNDASDRSL